MKWQITLFLLFIDALLCKAENGGGTILEQDDTIEEEEDYAMRNRHHGTEGGVGEMVFEKKCRTLGGEEAVISAKKGKERMMACAQSLVNVRKLQSEIMHNRNNEELHAIFKKDCREVQRIQECLSDFFKAIDPCLKEEEKVIKQTIHDVTDALISFICYKEGEHIISFITNGGLECLTEKKEEMNNCMNSTSIAKHLLKKMPDAESLPLLVLGESQCLEINDLQTCVVKSLEMCREPTPANIVDTMMNDLKKSSPCAKYLADNGSGNFVNPLAQTMLSAFIVFALLAFQ